MNRLQSEGVVSATGSGFSSVAGVEVVLSCGFSMLARWAGSYGEW